MMETTILLIIAVFLIIAVAIPGKKIFDDLEEGVVNMGYVREKVDFEKVLKEKLSEETFSIISSSEKEFGDWLDRLKRDAERCGELYEKAVMVKQNRRIRFAKEDSVKIKIKDLLWEIGQNAIIIICWEFGQWLWSWLL